MFKRKKKDQDRQEDKPISLCIFCSFAKKGGHGEDYYCDAKKEYVSWNIIDKGEITDCIEYHDIESAPDWLPSRDVHPNIMCPRCEGRNISRAGYGTRFICRSCGKIFR